MIAQNFHAVSILLAPPISTMIGPAAFALFMAISPSTLARRLALHEPVTKALHAGLSPVAGVDEVVRSVSCW